MPEEKPTNAWGEPIEDESPDDPHYVPPEQRLDHDQSVGSYALGTTGDDVDLANRERYAYTRAQEDEARLAEEEE